MVMKKNWKNIVTLVSRGFVAHNGRKFNFKKNCSLVSWGVLLTGTYRLVENQVVEIKQNRLVEK